MLPRAAVTKVAAAGVIYPVEPFHRRSVTPPVERHPNCDRTAEAEDVRLMCRAREGDVRAFSSLFSRHRERVEAFLFRLFWDREKAEDGAQEVFLRLWMSRCRYEPRAR